MKQKLEQAIAAAVTSLTGNPVKVDLTRPDEEFGDFATNVALQEYANFTHDINQHADDEVRFALPNKNNPTDFPKNPREFSDLIVKKLQVEIESIASVAVAGSGFINIRLHDHALLDSLAASSEPADYAGQNVLAEYSDPNPFKPLHAGHLYTTLVGDVIARLVERGGGSVTRLNYGGDVGLHAGKSMWGILRALGGENPDKLAEIPEGDRPQWLGERYVEANAAYEDDEQAKAEIIAVNKRVYQLHASGDRESPFARVYWTTRQWSYDYFAVLYGQLGVHSFDRFIPESEVTPLGLQTVREQQQKGVYQESDGAVVYKAEDRGHPNLHTRVFVTSEGLPAYEAKEIGLLLTKWRDYHFDKSIVITATEQDQYMQVVLASAAEFEPEAAGRTHHITHGVVKLQGGIKMSSRRGNTVGALDILEAARAAGQESGRAASEDTILAAVKYAFLRVRIGADVIYDPRESVALEGNSGPYLQYAHARARSILAKAAQAAGESHELSGDLEAGERSLTRKLSQYPEVIDRAVAELLPHHICTYLYELAQTFNSFYEHNRVIGHDREVLRLSLVALYADTLRDGLELLGITAPDSM